jgi:methanogenic corrinoid protein MtbC1
MTPALNIAALARRTGVQPDTLRKWEHRYGVIRPDRTPGGQRRYSERDVARVEWLKARLSEGYRIGEAAELLGSTDVGSAPQGAEELQEALYAAVAESDAPALEVLVQHALAVSEVQVALTDVFTPLLRRVGAGWASGELSVAQEHLVSGVIRAHLQRLLADARASVRGVGVLACAPGERHELGLLMLAILLRADGWQIAYLGSDTPVADAAELAATLDASLLCFSATMPTSVAELDAGLRGTTKRHGQELVVGGAAVSASVAKKLGARAGDSDLAASVAALRP